MSELVQMSDFDPLSFFSAPETVTKVEHENVLVPFELQKDTDESLSDAVIGDQNDGLIHFLDLPILNKALPRDVVYTILQLLQPEQETNFNGSYATTDKTMSEILELRNLNLNSFNKVTEWLRHNGYPKLSKNLIDIQFSQDFFQYLNKILSSSIFQKDDEIIQLTSLRISENCGRTARPNFQRKILIKNLKNEIFLNEPALTSDSLGLKTWGSSLMLSEFIVENSKRLLMEPILELGAGTGLVGITIGLLSYSILMTDLPDILPNLLKNTELNSIKAECAVLDWTAPEGFIEEKGDLKFNTIVISDPIYSPDHPRWVVNMMKQFLNDSKEARILLQIPKRETFEKERDLLWELIEREGFIVVEEEYRNGFDDFGAQEFIYKQLRWKAVQ